MAMEVDHRQRATLASASLRPTIINARAAARPHITGVERWAREMAVRLPELDPDRYLVASPPAALSMRPGQAWEQVVLPAFAAGRRAAAIYNPANLAPLAWPRNVVQIHDVVALRHPEWYSGGYVEWQRRVMPRIARWATLVVTVSEFARAEISEFLGVPSERIRVVPGGVDGRFSPAVDPGPLKRRLRLDKPYVLTIGDRGPRKNLAGLSPLIEPLRAEGIELVVAGGSRGHQLGAPLAGARDLGYVADEELPALYAGARAFVLPSLHEGFGLTALEAMAAGVPVAASSRAALPELIGNAGLLADPANRDAFTAAVMAAATDERERARLSAEGPRLAARYTWQRAADALHALLVRLDR
jgi:glycosyltransferase involved in cell wall biosynthesis